MFNSLANILIVLIPLSIFIGRAIVEARSKRAPPPRIPVHFEDDDEPEYFKRKTSAHSAEASNTQAAKTARRQKVLPSSASIVTTAFSSEGDTGSSLVSTAAGSPRAAPARRNTGTGTDSPERKDFVLNLNHLSPMKQAVVMAEILGPPKGMV